MTSINKLCVELMPETVKTSADSLLVRRYF